MKTDRRVVLIVADGWGIAPAGPGNYIEQSNKPNFDRLWGMYPHCQNQAAGNAVGLPSGSQGNSEVGHLHLGAGRVIWQMYELINRSIKDGSFFTNERLLKAMAEAKGGDRALHLIGLCSDEGVHAHLDHLLALIKLSHEKGVERVFVHFIADGRDVPEKSAKEYIKKIESAGGKIASVVGRYYALDRDKNWDRTEQAYNLLLQGRGHKYHSATEAVDQAYLRGDKTDYYIEPTVIVDGNDQPLAKLNSNDTVIFFNFRTDRPRQLSHALTDDNFSEFKRTSRVKLNFYPFTAYDESYQEHAVFMDNKIEHNLGQVLANHGLKQLRIAETEKYAHVTYFFNSQVERPNHGEDRLLIPSKKVPSFDLAPKMSADGVAKAAIENISTSDYGFILINFANCDLVGHSAVKSAIITCVEEVDRCVGLVIDAAIDNDYTIILTADHGSAEDKLYSDGSPKPAHSCNPVPFILIGNNVESYQLHDGGQSDVAPTILKLMNLDQPQEMTGKALF